MVTALRNLVLFLIALVGTASAVAGPAVYQWSVSVDTVVSEETGKAPRAYLWIPPTCDKVRGVVLGQHNMLEEPLLEHPAFRAALADAGFAAVWVTPAIGGLQKFGPEEGRHFEKMLHLLAAESGYSELAEAPVLPIGHSAMAEFPYLFAAWNPARTLAAISLKGSWPEPQKPWSGRDVAGVPLLLVSGEYEWADERAGKALWFRREFPAIPFSMFADAGGGHFDMHDALAECLGDYVRAVAKHRLGTPLRVIDATKDGWLVDRWRIDKSPRAAAAAVADYKGDVRDSYWCFDEAHARATEKLQAAYAGRKPQLAGYMQAGKVVEQNAKTHQQVTLDFLPDGDGTTFKLSGAFLDTVPEGRPVRWTGQPAGTSISHADGAVTIRRICGPVEKIAEDTFAIRFDRLGFDNPKRSAEVWLLAEHPGDATFKRAVQQSVLHFPLKNTAGAAQTISFAPIPDQIAGSAENLPLKASSSAKGRVRFCVREGPAEVTEKGDALRFTAIPPRAKWPVKVTVVGWQWGSSIDPKLQSAEPVERTFLLRQNSVTAGVAVEKPGIAIPSGFAGLSREWRPFPVPPNGDMAGVHPKYLRLLANLCAFNDKPLNIRIGGASADGMRTPPDANRWQQIAKVFQATRTPLIINVGLARGDAELAKAWVRDAHTNLPAGAVASIEFGNEPDGWVQHKKKPEGHTFENYLDEFHTIGSQIVPALTPGFAGPAWAHGAPLEILEPFIAKQRGLLNMITVHAYRFDPKSNPATERLLRNAATAGMAEYLAPGIALAHKAGLQIRLGETGSAWGGGLQGFSDSMAASIFTLDFLMELANAGLDGVNFHGGGVAAYTPIEETVDTKTWRTDGIAARAPYYGMLVFAEAAANEAHIVPLEITEGKDSSVKLWATRDKENTVRILAMNKSLTASGSVVLTGIKNGAILKRLTAPTATATRGITWAGQTFDDSPDGAPVGALSVETLAKDGETLRFTLAPCSAALVMLK
jgi:hypothetical protein